MVDRGNLSAIQVFIVMIVTQQITQLRQFIVGHHGLTFSNTILAKHFWTTLVSSLPVESRPGAVTSGRIQMVFANPVENSHGL